jgi:hypothetical protein
MVIVRNANLDPAASWTARGEKQFSSDHLRVSKAPQSGRALAIAAARSRTAVSGGASQS